MISRLLKQIQTLYLSRTVNASLDAKDSRDFTARFIWHLILMLLSFCSLGLKASCGSVLQERWCLVVSLPRNDFGELDDCVRKTQLLVVHQFKIYHLNQLLGFQKLRNCPQPQIT